MSTAWKWIFGIVIVLVVAALVVGAVFIVRNRSFMTASLRPGFGNGQTRPNFQATPNPNGAPNAPASPNNRPFGFNGQKGPMMPYGFSDRNRPFFGGGMHDQMMGRGGFSRFGGMMPFGLFGLGFFFLGGFFHLLIPLGILALVAFIFYQMGRRAGASAAALQAPAPVVPTPVETPRRGRKVAKS